MPAIGGDFCQLHLSDNLLTRGPRLIQFLINLGRIDLGQQLAFGYAAPDILVPTDQVAVGASVDGRFFIGQQRARQNQIFVRFFRLGIHYRDGGHGLALGFIGQSALVTHARQHGEASGRQQNQQQYSYNRQSLARRCRGKIRRRLNRRRLVARMLPDGFDLLVTLGLST